MQKNAPASARPRIGIALGSGASRGWAHIGVIQELAAMGIEPAIVAGCSIGALVGASYAAGRLDSLETWVRSLTKLDVARFFELNISLNGFVDKDRLRVFLAEHVCDETARIEHLGKRLGTVATDLESGREIWFTQGSAMQAIWASMALPGLFPPIEDEERWLVDGGLVNPVPVSLCRVLGADLVIAVNLNADVVGRVFARHEKARAASDSEAGFMQKLRGYSASLFPAKGVRGSTPSLYEAIAGSVSIAQDRITRSRMAGDPPDIVLTPRLGTIGLLEFHRAADAIQEGVDCVRRLRDEIRHVMD